MNSLNRDLLEEALDELIEPQRGVRTPFFEYHKIHCNCMSTGDKGIAKKRQKGQNCRLPSTNSLVSDVFRH